MRRVSDTSASQADPYSSPPLLPLQVFTFYAIELHLCIAIAFAGPTSFDTITFEGVWKPAKTWVVTDASCALIGLVCAAFIKPSHVRTSCFRGRVLLDALGWRLRRMPGGRDMRRCADLAAEEALLISDGGRDIRSGIVF